MSEINNRVSEGRAHMKRGGVEPEWFKKFKEAARGSRDDLIFVSHHLGEEMQLDWSVESVGSAERFVHKHLRSEARRSLLDDASFTRLLSLFCGECITRLTTGTWQICNQKSSWFYGQPMVVGYGGNKWDEYHPLVPAKSLAEGNLTGYGSDRFFWRRARDAVREFAKKQEADGT